MFNTIMKREGESYYESADLRAVTLGRFQVLAVDNDISIKAFIWENTLTFKVGQVFYKFTKTETIQGYKEIILMERTTGEATRQMLSLLMGSTVLIKPSNLEKYVVFVQSTSANCKLIGERRFLYEVEDWDR